MTTDRAIRILGTKDSHVPAYSWREREEAEKLGIEALKAYQKSQANGWYPPGYKLPGETEE